MVKQWSLTEGCFSTGWSAKNHLSWNQTDKKKLFMLRLGRMRGELRQKKQILPSSWHVGTTERRSLWLEYERVKGRMIEDEVTELGRGQVSKGRFQKGKLR